MISITEYLRGGSPAEVRVAIDDFDSALQSRQVLVIVAEVAPLAPTYRIATDAVGEGGDVLVSIEAPTQASAEQALDAGVREALILVSQSVGRQTGRRLVAANAVAGDAVRDLQDIENAAGAADLEAEVARRSGDLLALRNQIAAAAGNPVVQNELEATLRLKQQEIADIEAQLLPWTNSRARFDLAVAASADASLELRQIETNEADLQTQNLLQSLRSSELSNLPDLLRVVVAASVVTAGAAVLMALFLGSERRRSRAEVDSYVSQRAWGDTPSGGIVDLDAGQGRHSSELLDDWWDDDLDAIDLDGGDTEDDRDSDDDLDTGDDLDPDDDFYPDDDLDLDDLDMEDDESDDELRSKSARQ